MRSYKDVEDATSADAQVAEAKSKDVADLQLAHDLMHWASELINGVLERNRIGTPLQALSFLCEAKRNVDRGVAEVDMSEIMHLVSLLISACRGHGAPRVSDQAISFLAGAKQDVDNADRETEMAERYLDWKQEGKAS